MSNEMFKELEKAINKELKTIKLDLTVKVKGFEKGFLMDLSRTLLNAEEGKKLNEAISTAWNRIRTKWFKEFQGKENCSKIR